MPENLPFRLIVINPAGVNVRKAPSLRGDIVGKMQPGEETGAEVPLKNADGQWARVPSLNGFVCTVDAKGRPLAVLVPTVSVDEKAVRLDELSRLEQYVQGRRSELLG